MDKVDSVNNVGITPLEFTSSLIDPDKTPAKKTEQEYLESLTNATRLQDAWPAVYGVLEIKPDSEEVLVKFGEKLLEIKPDAEQITWSIVGISSLDEIALRALGQDVETDGVNHQAVENVNPEKKIKALDILSRTEKIKDSVGKYTQLAFHQSPMEVARNFMEMTRNTS